MLTRALQPLCVCSICCRLSLLTLVGLESGDLWHEQAASVQGLLLAGQSDSLGQMSIWTGPQQLSQHLHHWHYPLFYNECSLMHAVSGYSLAQRLLQCHHRCRF